VETARAVFTDMTKDDAFGVGGMARVVELVIERELYACMHARVTHLPPVPCYRRDRRVKN